MGRGVATGRGRRRTTTTLGLAGLAWLTACSSTAPAAGVTRIDRAVVVAYKPCPGDDAAIGRIELYGSDDPETPVWVAAHRSGEVAVLDLPVVPRYPGYDITDDRPGGRLDPGQRYSFEATATDSTGWGGPGFSVDDLEQGRVRVAGQELAFAEWVDSPTSCPRLTFVDALLTGLVVAAVAGAGLLLLRRVTRRGRPSDAGVPGPVDRTG
ncbi:MAG TPA: hypothetical protein VHK88_01400 [Aquihabitans sp.]|jgi:hypothetical protein|nr:hypothetical protein [Aquihabitans sp.]